MHTLKAQYDIFFILVRCICVCICFILNWNRSGTMEILGDSYSSKIKFPIEIKLKDEILSEQKFWIQNLKYVFPASPNFPSLVRILRLSSASQVKDGNDTSNPQWHNRKEELFTTVKRSLFVNEAFPLAGRRRRLVWSLVHSWTAWRAWRCLPGNRLVVPPQRAV